MPLHIYTYLKFIYLVDCQHFDLILDLPEVLEMSCHKIFAVANSQFKTTYLPT